MAEHHTKGPSLRAPNCQNLTLSLTALFLPLAQAVEALIFFLGNLVVSKEERPVKPIKSLEQNVVAYGTHLAITTLSLQVDTILKDLRNVAMDLNTFSIDHCEAIRSLCAPGLPQNSALHETVCRKINQGDGTVYLGGGRKNCSAYTNTTQAITNAQNDPSSPHKEPLVNNVNLVQKSVEKIGIPPEMRQGLMARAGTVVIVGEKNHRF